MWIKIQQMQQYADIYSLQNYSTCFGCHSTHHQPPVQVILLVPLLPSNVVWSGLRPEAVPEAAGTVFNTSDDGCCDTQNT